MARNIKDAKFYTNVNVGKEGYNPQIIKYYNASDQLVKIDETWRGSTYSQTISGTGVASQTVSYNIVYDPWVEV